MIKIVVHAPKGGVGKTTLATNIALFLARNNYKVWALDLAQGALMSEVLSGTDLFQRRDNKIETEELGELPSSFEGARQFDYLVADTDDYYNITADIAFARGWRVIVPIVNEHFGIHRISDEISEIMLASMLDDNIPNLKIFANKCEEQSDYRLIKSELKKKELDGLLSDVLIEYCHSDPPIFINDENFYNTIKNVLTKMEVF